MYIMWQTICSETAFDEPFGSGIFIILLKEQIHVDNISNNDIFVNLT
jgi:hypothetical protein